MRIRGMGKLRRVVRRLRNRFAPGSLILLYHRVARVDSDPWSLSVTPQHFAEHLEVLRKYARPLGLQQLNRDLEEGKRLHRRIAITFDDGYADNLHNARPLLERYNIPATVFVASGYVGYEHEFWWDELERLFLQPGRLPETLRLNINGSNYQWELGISAVYSEDAYQRHRRWSADGQSPPTSRHSLYYALWQLLCPMLASDRRQVLDRLLEWAGAAPGSRPTHRSLTEAQVLALEQGELIEVGCHTVTHPFLSTLPVNLQQQEIQQSKARLEEILGHQVRSFAYPSGNYSAVTIDVVRDAGFTCACSTIHASVRRNSDRFVLPRVEVQNWDGDEFAKRLSRWFDV